jgi:RNA polymerase sigma factor (sigma-70 family)
MQAMLRRAAGRRVCDHRNGASVSRLTPFARPARTSSQEALDWVMGETPATDDALMAAFAQGDVSAFDRLYERHHASLYRFVRRLLGVACSAQTDEVFQDTWLRVVQARARWAPQGASFRTWLFTLAHHRAVDCLRRSGREVSVDVNDETEPWTPDTAEAPWALWPDASASNAEDQLFWRRAGERLLSCLEALPATQKTVFLLHHEDGLSLDELAQALELGFETAKSRLRYAMAKLRTCMGAYLPHTANLVSSAAPATQSGQPASFAKS